MISTFHAGIPYVIEDRKTGLLVKEWDVGGLTEAILEMAASDNLRESLGAAAQKYALADLDLAKNEHKLENIYNLFCMFHTGQTFSII